jgi:hypothetical protein
VIKKRTNKYPKGSKDPRDTIEVLTRAEGIDLLPKDTLLVVLILTI